MTSTAIPASAILLAQIADPAARALLLAAAAGLGLTAFRVKTTSTRLFTWTAVLYAALAMPFLKLMLPPLPIPTPAFLQNAVKNAGASRREKAAADESQRGERLSLRESQRPVASEVRASELSFASNAQPTSTTLVAPASPASIPWSTVAAGIYLAVAFFFLVRFSVGLEFGRRLRRASRTIDDPRVTQRLASRAHAAGLAFSPQAAESELISVPVTMGALRSMILLPSSWREWDDPKLDAVVAHEVSHVARRDALTQCLSLLHRAIFWFSPLAWWLDRRLADLAEQASDEAALSCGTDRRHYARILLGFFEALHTAPGRVWWQGVSMAKAGQAEQRVERILSWKGSIAMRLQKSIAVVVVALAVPAVYLAASAHPAQHIALGRTRAAQDHTPPPAAKPAPAPTSEATPPPELAPAESGPATGVTGATADGAIDGTVSGVPTPPSVPPAPGPGIGRTVIAPIAPSTPIRPMTPMAPVAPVVAWSRGRSRSSGSSSGRGYSYAYGFDDEQRFVIVTGKSDSFTMSGSAEDARHVEKLRKTIPGDFIWFERDEKSYVIRDQATIDRARKFWAPQEELGKKQEALGKQQEILGKQQEELGAKMEQIHVTVPDMSAELDKLKAELKQLSSSATMEQVGHIQAEIGELQSKIGDLQSHAGEQQGKLGEEMGALGEKQGKLGEQQGELGRQQAELAEEASRQMKQLLDEAIKKGTAQPEL
jgi:beta-lactamase regulating signal transducer with metallopeptidase domain